MGLSWVAGSVRSRSLTLRCLGAERARSIAASPSLDGAIHELLRSAYARDIRPGQTLAEAQRAILATALWHLRVLAGWLPRSGAELARILAGYWEMLNLSLLLGALAGEVKGRPFTLGALDTVWRRAGSARTPGELRAILAASPWGDPGTSTAPELVAWLRLRWAERVAQAVPGAFDWGSGLLAILVARELFVARRRPGPERWPVSPLGSGWRVAMTLPEFATRLPRGARWALDGIDDPIDLWRAEAGWWTRVEADALARLTRFRPGQREAFVASAALLLADSWRTRAALVVAAQGGEPLEAFDAIA